MTGRPFDRSELLSACGLQKDLPAALGVGPADFSSVARALAGAVDFESLVSDLEGSSSTTFIALAWVLRQAMAQPDRPLTCKSLTVEEGEPQIIWGDLRVSGHVYNGGTLVVLGDVDADTFNDG
jgi:hypothetical protein